VTHDAEFSDGLTLLIRFRNDIDSRVADNIQTLAKESSWGLLHAIYKRAYTHVEGCFVLFSHGYHSCAEALCRTAIEASINLYFFSLGDTEEKLICYFKDYISTERNQNRKWLGSDTGSKYSEEAKQHHYNSVAAKEVALRRYEGFLANAFDQIGRNYEQNSQPWPSLFNRFKLIDKEVDYRTIYSALCSQAHNDAEDLINEFWSKGSQLKQAHERQERENRNFGLYMVLMALATLVESAAIYLAKYSLGANETLIPLLTEVEDVIHRVPR
jgi:hypothetical protein